MRIPSNVVARLSGLSLLLFLTACADQDPSRQALPESIAIVLPSSLAGDPALALASQEVRTAAHTFSSGPVSVVTDADFPRLSGVPILVGDAGSWWIAELLREGRLALPQLSEEGYLLRHTTYRGNPVLIVAGRGPLGMAYGLFGLARELRLDPTLLSRDFYRHVEPAMTLRLLADPSDPNYPPPEVALRWGFNAIAVQPWPSLVRYDGYDPAIYHPKRFPSERTWVEQNRGQAQERIRAAKALHLKVVSPGDVFSLPRQVLGLYGGEVAESHSPPQFCLGRPKARALLTYAVAEVLRDFPEIDALMIRTGESYPLGPLVGNPPDSPGCGSWEQVGDVLRLVRRVVVEEHGKLLIQRAWDLGAGGFHGSPQVARQVLRGVPPGQGLVLSFKHTQTDFWRFNSFNPNLGHTGFPEMVEFQVAREYEGKGAFPNYLGGLYARGDSVSPLPSGLAQAYGGGVRALWVWPRGGGWGGPEPALDLWNESNLYALSRLAWDPQADPEGLAREWATLYFGPDAGPLVTELLRVSSEAALKMFYASPYARAESPWAPNDLWVRDDQIFGGYRLAPLYEASRAPEDFARALEEKEEAVALVERMIGLLRLAQPKIADQALAAGAMNTLYYQRSLARTLHHYVAGMFHFYRWQEQGEEADRKEALNHLRQWEQAWREHRHVIPQLSGVATPYQDAGMVATVEEAQRALQAR